MNAQDARELLDDVFEEEALIIGGLAELHSVEDELIDRLFRSFAVVRDKALRRIDGPDSAGPNHDNRLRSSHPAIEEFLVQIGRW